ncbi:unnamed protein product (mitochondrion) [Plasmodiophora brassicae]|uniref:Uncharacterized protein n=1 Tax=Plasmodiophora brassicae TaxID=37360 RepID=A0A3P3XYX4_PLABS|nr:unnamed protein product [Plasmodiophora brassicae]
MATMQVVMYTLTSRSPQLACPGRQLMSKVAGAMAVEDAGAPVPQTTWTCTATGHVADDARVARAPPPPPPSSRLCKVTEGPPTSGATAGRCTRLATTDPERSTPRIASKLTISSVITSDVSSPPTMSLEQQDKGACSAYYGARCRPDITSPAGLDVAGRSPRASGT